MKKIILTILVVLFIGNVSAQKKEELLQRLTQLESNVSSLQNDNAQMQTTIDNLKASLKVATDANALLENKINFQEEINKNQASALQQLQKEMEELKKQSIAADPSALITDPKNEEDSIISVVQLYAGVKNLQEMLKVVYSPNRVEEKIKKYYDQGFNARLVDKKTVSIPSSGYQIGDKFIVNARTPQGYGLDPIYVRKTAEGFKVDWEATKGYNGESYDSYEARRGTDKIILRINVYNLREAPWDKYGVGSNYYDVGDCYVLKTSAAGQKIAQLCRDGKGAKITVEVQGQSKYSDYNEKYKYFAFITRIISEDWFSQY